MRSRQSKIENREKGLIDKVEITTGFLELLCNFFFSHKPPRSNAPAYSPPPPPTTTNGEIANRRSTLYQSCHNFYEYGFFLLLANWGNRSVKGKTPMILAILIFFATNLCVFAPNPVCLRGKIFPVSDTKRVDNVFASFQSIDRATSASRSFPFFNTLRVF